MPRNHSINSCSKTQNVKNNPWSPSRFLSSSSSFSSCSSIFVPSKSLHLSLTVMMMKIAMAMVTTTGNNHAKLGLFNPFPPTCPSSRVFKGFSPLVKIQSFSIFVYVFLGVLLGKIIRVSGFLVGNSHNYILGF